MLPQEGTNSMPIHDWTQVAAGTFHHFHTAWIIALSDALNDGVLPEGYYAMGEQVSGSIVPDVLTLYDESVPRQSPPANHEGMLAVADAPPKVLVTAFSSEPESYALRRRRLVIRHVTGDSVVAVVEIISPGNKSNHAAFEKFVDKVLATLYDSRHILLVDLLPPGPYDPTGIHGAIWDEIAESAYQPPSDKLLTLASYEAGPIKRAYVQPLAVGDVLPDMPLFLEPEWYVNVPLERTYRKAYPSVPRKWRDVLES
jgi:hypothetical protein